jgi:uncharacterized membrane protein
MKEHNTNTEITYMKSYYVIQIICILEGILEKIFIDHIDKSKQNHEDYNIKINKSSLIKGIEEIINSLLTESVVNVVIPPGVSVTSVGVGNLGAPVVTQGYTTTMGIGNGILR